MIIKRITISGDNNNDYNIINNCNNSNSGYDSSNQVIDKKLQ